MKKSRVTLPTTAFILLLGLTMLACGPLSSSQIEQAKEGAGTAAAAAQTAAEAAQTTASQLATARPTLQAGAGEAIDQAATAVAQLATQAPTIQAQAGEIGSMVATVGASSSAGGGELIATAQASDIDLSALQAAINNLEPDENGNYTLTITEEQLNSAVALRQTAAAENGEAPAAQNLRFKFGDGAILLEGEINTPVQAPLSAKLTPVMGLGLRFDISDVKIGDFTVPNAVAYGAETALNKAVGDALAFLPASIILTDVTITEGALTISGRRN